MNLRVTLLTSILMLQGCALQGHTRNEAIACNLRYVAEDAQLSPELHYKRMQSCLKVGRTQRALDHFALAGTGTWYDAQIRPGETTFKRHQVLLQSALNELDDGTREKTWNDFSIMMKNRKQLADVCDYVASVAAKRRQTQVFDDLVWEQAREGYLHCEADKV